MLGSVKVVEIPLDEVPEALEGMQTRHFDMGMVSIIIAKGASVTDDFILINTAEGRTAKIQI